MSRYRYIGSKPYLLIVGGTSFNLKSGDELELPSDKLKTRQMRARLRLVEE